MTKLKIITVPNPLLKEKAKKVGSFGNSLKKFISEMIQLLREVNGIGLAAPQLGKPIRIVVIESRGKPSRSKPQEKRPLIPLTILINPEVINHSLEVEEDIEGCLSLPNIWGTVPRYKKVTVKGINERGKGVKIKASGLLARTLQHEIDHLDGILFPQRVEDLSTLHKITSEGEIMPIDLPKL